MGQSLEIVRQCFTVVDGQKMKGIGEKLREECWAGISGSSYLRNHLSKYGYREYLSLLYTLAGFKNMALTLILILAKFSQYKYLILPYLYKYITIYLFNYIYLIIIGFLTFLRKINIIYKI